jgi:Flp pilus assembly pilin Flp
MKLVVVATALLAAQMSMAQVKEIKSRLSPEQAKAEVAKYSKKANIEEKIKELRKAGKSLSADPAVRSALVMEVKEIYTQSGAKVEGGGVANISKLLDANFSETLGEMYRLASVIKTSKNTKEVDMAKASLETLGMLGKAVNSVEAIKGNEAKTVETIVKISEKIAGTATAEFKAELRVKLAEGKTLEAAVKAAFEKIGKKDLSLKDLLECV